MRTLGFLGALLGALFIPREKAWAQEAAEQRKAMIRDHLAGRDITDERVLAAMGKVPREQFVPPDQRAEAYADSPLPIGHGQTISQPYIVAFMTQQLALKPQDRVLEVGTGSGYQAAILAELAAEVYSIEIVEPLAKQAQEALAGYKNVHVRAGDGYEGWPEAAPFDAIIVTCAPDHVPPALAGQLAEGGRLIIPVGPEGGIQELVLLKKENGVLRRTETLPVRFVPMTGAAETR